MTKAKRSKNKSARILIVDDHPVVREGLSALLGREPDLEVCGEAGSVKETLRLVDETSPDLVIIDISLDGGDGLDLISRIHARDVPVRMLVCSLYDDTLFAERSLRAGAMGYVNKREARRVIVTAIRRVLEGKVYLSNEMSEHMTYRLVGSNKRSDRPSVDVLSDRELEVFRMIGNGLTTAEIANRLHVALKTVGTHRWRIKQKLGVSTGAQLARAAAQWAMKNG